MTTMEQPLVLGAASAERLGATIRELLLADVRVEYSHGGAAAQSSAVCILEQYGVSSERGLYFTFQKIDKGSSIAYRVLHNDLEAQRPVSIEGKEAERMFSEAKRSFESQTSRREIAVDRACAINAAVERLLERGGLLGIREPGNSLRESEHGNRCFEIQLKEGEHPISVIIDGIVHSPGDPVRAEYLLRGQRIEVPGELAARLLEAADDLRRVGSVVHSISGQGIFAALGKVSEDAVGRIEVSPGRRNEIRGDTALDGAYLDVGRDGILCFHDLPEDYDYCRGRLMVLTENEMAGLHHISGTYGGIYARLSERALGGPALIWHERDLADALCGLVIDGTQSGTAASNRVRLLGGLDFRYTEKYLLEFAEQQSLAPAVRVAALQALEGYAAEGAVGDETQRAAQRGLILVTLQSLGKDSSPDVKTAASQALQAWGGVPFANF